MSRLREDDDTALTRVYRFKRLLDRNRGEEDPAMAVAYEIYQTSYSQRMMLEGLLIAGADKSDIEGALGLHPQVSEIYHDAFFAVRPWLPHVMQVVACIFDGSLQNGVHQHDRLGIAHRVSWLLGKQALVEYCAAGTMSAEQAERMRMAMERILLQNGLETAMTASRHSENAHEFIKIAFTPRDKSKDQSSSGKTGANPELQEAMEDFMGHLTISVADPTDPSNLTQSAREPREAEYEVKS